MHFGVYTKSDRNELAQLQLQARVAKCAVKKFKVSRHEYEQRATKGLIRGLGCAGGYVCLLLVQGMTAGL